MKILWNGKECVLVEFIQLDGLMAIIHDSEKFHCVAFSTITPVKGVSPKEIAEAADKLKEIFANQVVHKPVEIAEEAEPISESKAVEKPVKTPKAKKS